MLAGSVACPGELEKTQVAQLAVVDPFAVAHCWFDRDFEWKFSDFSPLSDYKLNWLPVR